MRVKIQFFSFIMFPITRIICQLKQFSLSLNQDFIKGIMKLSKFYDLNFSQEIIDYVKTLLEELTRKKLKNIYHKTLKFYLNDMKNF